MSTILYYNNNIKYWYVIISIIHYVLKVIHRITG